MILFQAQALHLPITLLPEFSESPAKGSRSICVKYSYALRGFLGGLSLFVEEKRR
jgi:hypothetical protein